MSFPTNLKISSLFVLRCQMRGDQGFCGEKRASLTEEDISAYCKQHLTSNKRPKYIEFRDALPKTNVGKILTRALRASA